MPTMTLRQLHSSYTILLAFLKIIKAFNFYSARKLKYLSVSN